MRKETEESVGGSILASGGVGEGGALVSGKLDPIQPLGYTECFVRIYCTLVRSPDLLDRLITLPNHFVSCHSVESRKEEEYILQAQRTQI
jgi:hypothetical protein